MREVFQYEEKLGIGGVGFGGGGDAYFVWEELLLVDLSNLLVGVSLVKEEKDGLKWKLDKMNVNSVKSAYSFFAGELSKKNAQ